MTDLKSYLDDGANHQARSVVTFLQGIIYGLVDKVDKSIEPEIKIGRYHNCREQGYVISFRFLGKHRHYAVYEHRNSDTICVLISNVIYYELPSVNIMWQEKGENPSKHDYDKGFNYGEIRECAEFILYDMLGLYHEIIENQVELKKQ